MVIRWYGLCPISFKSNSIKSDINTKTDSLCDYYQCSRWQRNMCSDWQWWGFFNWGWNWKSFPDTSSEEELTEWFQLIFRLCKKESSFLWEPANILQIKIHNQRDVNFLLKLQKLMFLPCMILALTWVVCHMHVMWSLKTLHLWKLYTPMSVYSATGHDLCLIGLKCCEISIDTSPFYVLSSSIYSAMNIPHMKAVSNVQFPAHSIALYDLRELASVILLIIYILGGNQWNNKYSKSPTNHVVNCSFDKMK